MEWIKNETRREEQLDATSGNSSERCSGDDFQWWSSIRVDAPRLVDLIIIGLVLLVLLLVLVGLVLNRRHQRQMRALFGDFFRFYIHVSK